MEFGEKQDIIGLYGMNGALIAKVGAEDVADEGFGFVKTTSIEAQQLVHKSGIYLEQLKHNQVDLVYPYVAFKNQQDWGLMSVTGRRMLPEEYDSIYTIRDNVVLIKETFVVGPTVILFIFNLNVSVELVSIVTLPPTFDKELVAISSTAKSNVSAVTAII